MEDFEKKLQELNERLKKVENVLFSSGSEKGVSEKKSERVSINEFLNSKKLTDDVKRTLAIAYWLEVHERTESFNSSDITTAFRSAKLKLPLNINDKINMNVKNGHLAEEKQKRNGKKAWYVTNSGIQFVESDLEKTKQ